MKVAVSWSGGKDGCLALHRLLQQGHEVAALVSMVSESNGRNRAHGIPLRWLRMQAEALGIPLMTVDSEPGYGMQLAEAMRRLRTEHGVEAIAFGTLYSDRDRGWNEGIAGAAGLEPLFPVWIKPERASYLLHQWISLGFKAVVCRAVQERLEPEWVGRELDWSFFHDIHATDLCVMGEYGEFHTFVVDGPIFRRRVELCRFEVVANAGLWSMDVLECRLVDKS